MTWALALLLGQDRAEAFFERITFEEARPEGAAAERVADLLKKREHWLAGFRAVEVKLGPFREGVELAVSFDYDGGEVARAATRGRSSRIRFNLRKLAEYQEKLDDLERRRKELEGEGKRLQFRVPPARLDRTIWHELAHVFHGEYRAPDWFLEGLAQWASEDPAPLLALAAREAAVEAVDIPLPERNDLYGRGQLFWSWVAARGAAKALVGATVLAGADWKEGTEKALGLSWASLREAEKEWSAKELVRRRR